ncbi:MAG: restriction endonuclease subunit S [Candidatus Atribacteria bacterium]|nr:restriction endonuclease subunit S [Candidatus Atribacteria bacterium]
MSIQLAKKYSNITWAEVDSPWLCKGECRLDGSFYCGDSVQSYLILDKFTKKIERISDFAKNVFYPGRFKRIWINEKYGKPFFSGAQILQAYPSTDKYIAPSKIPNINFYKVTPQHLLVTRSGTIGKLTFTTEKLSNQLVTEHAIRIEIQDDIERGYIYAYLKSNIGNPLILQSVFGAVIDQIEPNHIEQIKIPIINKIDFGKVGSDIVEAFSLRDKANRLIDESQALFYKLLDLPKISENDVQCLKDKKAKVWEINEFGFENRFDSSFYHPLADLAIEKLKESKYPVSTLSDRELIEKIFMPGRFKRIYIKKGFGIPFLSGKNIIQSTQDDIKFLAKTKDAESYIIKIGWVLITRSGTIGRTSLVTQQWDNLAATEHIIRIIPKDIDSGYLITFLNSNYGQNQITRFIHGSVVDEISETQIKQIVVPVPEKDIQIQIGEKAQKAFKLRDKANKIEEKAIEFLEKKIKESV